jgi:hypothetical protein
LLKDFWCCERAPELQRFVNHDFFLGDDFGAPCETGEVVARITVVLLDGDGVFFPMT